jgi:cation diffusion facilitator CzcD-associated flavoprotein CzcO
MKKITALTLSALMTATALGAAAIPAAANAQVTIRYGTPGYWTPERSNAIRQQIWRLDRDIDRAAQNRRITRREEVGLRRDVQWLRNQYNAYSRNGLNFQEVRTLQNRVNQVRAKLRLERSDWDREDYWRGNRWQRDRDGDGVPNRMDPRPNRPY